MPKGQSGNPSGRPKGAKSLIAGKAREIIVNFIDERAESIDKWINEIYAKEGASEALKVYLGLLEFALPKLSRQDIVVEGTVLHAVESLSRGRDRLNGGELSSVPVLPAPNETIVSEANTADN